MNKIYHLSSCDTCRKIINELGLKEKGFIMQDIKTEKISPAQLDEMVKLSGNHESLFSRIALKYRSLGLKELAMTEKDYRKYILEEYTFLKRPVIIIGKKIFIGNSKDAIKKVKEHLNS
jgi:arsenate reductase